MSSDAGQQILSSPPVEWSSERRLLLLFVLDFADFRVSFLVVTASNGSFRRIRDLLNLLNLCVSELLQCAVTRSVTNDTRVNMIIIIIME